MYSQMILFSTFPGKTIMLIYFLIFIFFFAYLRFCVWCIITKAEALLHSQWFFFIELIQFCSSYVHVKLWMNLSSIQD